jgi:hypothetical protein
MEGFFFRAQNTGLSIRAKKTISLSEFQTRILNHSSKQKSLKELGKQYVL